MTVSTETARVAYTGNGTTGPFTVPFYFLENDDLKVVRRTTATGAEYTMILTTDYTLTGAGDQAGGELTLVAAMSNAYTLSIIRDPDTLQGVDYTTNDKFPAATHERALDKLTMLVQRVKDQVSRALKLSDGDTTTSVVLPSPVANSVFGWNATADAIITYVLTAGTALVDLAASSGSALIGFIQAGVGAILRTVQAKLRERVSVLDYGADNTGAMDASAAIQACIDANFGKWIYMPAGTYLLSNPLEINDQSSNILLQRPATKMVGDGIAVTTLRNNSGDYAIKSSATTWQATNRSFAYHGALEDFSINCNTDGTHLVGGSGISLESYWWPKINDVEVSGSLEHGLCTKANAVFTGLGINTDYYSCGVLRVMDCELSAAAGWNVYSDNASNTFNIDSGYIVNGGIGGIYLGSASGHSIRRVSVAGNGRGGAGVAGIHIDNAGSTPHNTVIEGVEFDNNYGYQLWLEGYNHLVVRNRFIQSGVASAGNYAALTCIYLDGTSSGFPQCNVVENNLFRFDSPDAGKPITGVAISDGASGLGNRCINNQFNTTVGVTKYAFAGTTRVGNYATENNVIVYGSAAQSYRHSVVAATYVGNSQLHKDSNTKVAINGEHTDTAGAFDTANNRFTAPHAGVLNIRGTLLFRPVTTANVPMTLTVRKNNVAVATFPKTTGFPTIGQDDVFSFNTNLVAAAGDYFELFVILGTVDTLYVTGSSTGSNVTFEML